METFYAVLKVTKSDGAGHTTGMFEAKDARDAIDKMCEKAKVKSTLELYEFELLRVEGRDYKIVARKFGSNMPTGEIYRTKTDKLPEVPKLPSTEVPNVFESNKQSSITVETL